MEDSKHCEAIVHWRGGEDCTSPICPGWEAFCSLSLNIGRLHCLDIFWQGRISFDCANWYQQISWRILAYLNWYLMSASVSYWIRQNHALGQGREEMRSGCIGGPGEGGCPGQAPFHFRYLTWEWNNGMGCQVDVCPWWISSDSLMDCHEGLLDWPPVKIHRGEHNSKAQWGRCRGCTQAHTRATHPSLPPLLSWP